MRQCLILLATLSLISTTWAAVIAQSPFAVLPSNKVFPPELQERIEDLRVRYDIPGITVGLAASSNFASGLEGKFGSKDWTLETASFGVADRYGNLVDENTLFCIASNSKLFTALSIGLLVQNDTKLTDGSLLGWSTKIKDILPEWKLQDEYASDHADLLDLLSMRSGLPRHDPSALATHPRNIVKALRYLKPSAELRQAWQYNNLHYITLSYIIETLSGTPQFEYVQKHIFDPLNMTATTYNATAAKESGHRSDGFVRTKMNTTACADALRAGQRLDQNCFGEAASLDWWTQDDALYDAGPGGITLSAVDMAKWVKELLDPSVLPADLIAKTTIGLSVPTGESPWPELGVRNYGLGQEVGTYRGFTVFSHTGGVPGQISIHMRVPEAGFGFFVAINEQDFGTALFDTIAHTILDHLLKLDPIDWENRILRTRLGNLPQFLDLPKDPRPPPQNLEGRYQHPAYGAFSLEHASPNLTAYLPTGVNLTGPIYDASLDTTFAVHLLFTHFDGPVFNWTAVAITDRYTERDDETRSQIVRTANSGTAVFTEQGFGMFGDWWGKGATAPGSVVTEHAVDINAEVWYQKI